MLVKKSGFSGYTLIEIAIVMVVIGLFFASGATAYNLYMKNKQIDDTINSANLVVNAVSNFLVQHGRYPCPARLDAERTDPDYGMETECDPLKLGYTALVAGQCGGGICIERSKPPSTAGKVRRGSVPFRVLGLPEKYAEDGYRMRIQYAVTEKLAVAETYVKNGGGISIIDDQGRSIINPPDTAHYVIFSSGPGKEGAYTRAGRLHLPCGTGVDGENCNTSPPNQDAVYSFARQAEAAGADHFDDYVKFYTSIDTPLWKIADGTGFHIRDLVEAENVTGGKIGVANITPSATFDINGIIKTDEKVYLGLLQDAADSSPFPPEKIAENKPEMDCSDPAHPSYDASKPYVIKIADGKTFCGPMPNIGCPSGQKMTGVNADGSIVCSSFLGCTTQSVAVCKDLSTGLWEMRTLPFGVANQTALTLPVSGTSRVDTYKCTGGSWVKQSTAGICACAAPTTGTVLCSTAMGSGGWTGTATTTTTQNCTTGVTTTTTDTSGCGCGPRVPEIASPTCASVYGFGFTGTYSKAREWVCDTSTTGHWDPWYVITNTCACTPQTQTILGTCPDPVAFTGFHNKKRDYTCPGGPLDAGVWGAPYDYAGGNTCACIVGKTKTTITGCPPGDVGSITKIYTYDCATETWSLTSTTSTCTPITYKWKSLTTPSTSTTVGGMYELGTVCTVLNQTSTCYSYGSGSTIYNYPSCTCQ